jgi:tetratricopeptide (TPR) repeat protein
LDSFGQNSRAPTCGARVVGVSRCLSPISNLFPLNATVAEHWLYLPSAFLLLAIAAALRATTLSATSRSLVLLLAATFACYWASAPGNGSAIGSINAPFLRERSRPARGFRAHARELGQLEAGEGRNDEALRQFHLALDRERISSFALLGIAAMEVRLGNYDEARTFLARRNDIRNAAEARQVRVALEYRNPGATPPICCGKAAELRR